MDGNLCGLILFILVVGGFIAYKKRDQLIELWAKLWR